MIILDSEVDHKCHGHEMATMMDCDMIYMIYAYCDRLGVPPSSSCLLYDATLRDSYYMLDLLLDHLFACVPVLDHRRWFPNLAGDFSCDIGN